MSYLSPNHQHKALTQTSSLAWPYPFFVDRRTPNGKGMAPFMLALWRWNYINTKRIELQLRHYTTAREQNYTKIVDLLTYLLT